ncbi:PepSY domain-containing protein [Candidatus Pacearchaeota archaeon]|nr:PepSY domain-containing protein [Candidatus Pacearchaeota archaeon]
MKNLCISILAILFLMSFVFAVATNELVVTANNDANISNDNNSNNNNAGVDEDDDDLNEVGERVCCKVYGLGSRMKQVNIRYGWTTENNCVTPEEFAGGGREIVEDKYCELKTQYPTRILTQAQVQTAVQTKNRLRIQAQEGECPENCVCSGSTIKCNLNGTRQMTITAGKSGNTIVQVKGINMSTNVTLYKSENKIYGMFKNNQTKEIRVLPDEIKEKIKERIKLKLEDENIELDDEGIYQIQGRKKARLFFLFPVRERVRIEIDSETGEMIKIRNPWWGFLARDSDEEIEEEEETEEGNESEEIEE